MANLHIKQIKTPPFPIFEMGGRKGGHSYISLSIFIVSTLDRELPAVKYELRQVYRKTPY